jgi:nicotinate phosphoribosyltransferase
MIVDRPIITSMLDDDWYKLTMGSVVFHNFPNAEVEYEFINRGKTPFPEGFVKELNHQIRLLANLRLTKEEESWLKTIPYIRPTYAEWLSGYAMNPCEVSLTQLATGELFIKIHGPWYRTIFWEVKLMAIISELYFLMTGQTKNHGWDFVIDEKAKELSINNCYWIDFGTRRRYSYEVQDKVVEIMKDWRGFLGTSNPHLAMKWGVTPNGTYAHEAVMAMSALYGVRMANKMWMKHWSDYFGGCLGVALTDTFTTDSFLNDFGSYEARLFDGLRQDSNDEYEWGEKVLAHYRKLGILTSNKRLVFSNNLSPKKYIPISNHFSQGAQPIAGIGTNFTNDCGPKALNMVIKMTRANFGQGWVNVVKLSDENGKHTGKPEAIRLVKEQLGIV